MKLKSSSTFGIHWQRGFWLRCFLGALLISTALVSWAQCVMPTMRVSRVRGAVFDRTGQPIAKVEISLKQEDNVVALATTDEKGKFDVPAPPGTYWLNAKASAFAPGYARLDVGNDLIRALKPANLWMILDVGMLGDHCPFATTSRRRFEKAITNHESRPTDHR
jgi:hypothetical protein